MKMSAQNHLHIVKKDEDSTPLLSNRVEKSCEESAKGTPDKTQVKQAVVWANVARFVYVHLGALWGLYKIIIEVRYLDGLFAFIYGALGQLGVTAGAHRLWSHRSYRAKWQLRVILAVFQTIAFQNDVFEWARDHRVHHKFSETDADPHNAKRGFFFSHAGWLLMKKHPDIREKGKVVDLSDLKKDPIIMWQKNYYMIIMPILAFVIPTCIPMYFWNTGFWTAWNITLLRWVLSLHATWLVNSAAHLWGSRPYDKDINPAENAGVSIFSLGEGWHNYHHVFPFDYKTSEYGMFNPTKVFIDIFARIGWAYDLKTVSEETLRRRILRTGDGTHNLAKIINDMHHNSKEHVWGWGDSDIQKDDVDCVNVVYKRKK